MLRVLVVDDEPLIRWSAAETLAEAGHLVVEAADGRSALACLAEGPLPDVILLDYRLPDSNDLALLAAIRRAAPASSVIMMTAYGTPDLMARASALGVHQVISKPFEIRALLPLVQDAAASRAQ